MPEVVFPSLIHRALMLASHAHGEQKRKGSEVPYISHPAAVGFILERAGFDEETVAAGILHDVVEDTPVTLETIERDFSPRIAKLVDYLTETKKGPDGVELPWQQRKDEKFRKMQGAPAEARAIALADKLHNLYSTLEDERAGRPVWSRFKVPRERWLENARRNIEACDGEDPRLHALAAACRAVLTAF